MELRPIITGETLLEWGFTPGKAIGLALSVIQNHFPEASTKELQALLSEILQTPASFLKDENWAETAKELLPPETSEIALNANPPGYSIYGGKHIEPGAISQMETAMQLPVTVAGALMPDAHQGYGLPIGGVLATDNAIIPYGVGVDIGCRMCLSIFDISDRYFFDHEAKFKRELIAHTRFGAGNAWPAKHQSEHAILDHANFNTIPLLKNLHQKAVEQLGTSGGGNHFVEWGIFDMFEDDPTLNIPKGKYVALLSHSGSRGFGATIAGHYTKLAKERCKLPKEAVNLAYLDMNTAEGQEYWLAMNLAGDYASACHEIIHRKLTTAMGGQLMTRVENHHNFAWKEVHLGKEVIVHRKGATPAGKGVLGIIPGSMTAPGFLVRGKGNETAINSASHGAGRQMSRTQAIKSITRNEMQNMLKDHGVTLIGAGLDEAPMAYKDIHAVMDAQNDLVDVLASFTPKIVRMADDGSRED